MFWRPLQGDEDLQYAVDAEGRLILGKWDYDTADYVIKYEVGVGYSTNERSNVQIPELNTWGNSPKKADIIEHENVDITYDGQHFVMAVDGSTFTPELQIYQP